MAFLENEVFTQGTAITAGESIPPAFDDHSGQVTR
jgi:hypothetical protein